MTPLDWGKSAPTRLPADLDNHDYQGLAGPAIMRAGTWTAAEALSSEALLLILSSTISGANSITSSALRSAEIGGRRRRSRRGVNGAPFDQGYPLRVENNRKKEKFAMDNCARLCDI
jgi:hypothetical protein